MKIRCLVSKIIMLSICCLFFVLMNGTEVEAAKKYNPKVYKRVLNNPEKYGGTVKFDCYGKVSLGEKVYINDSDNLYYVIKDITGDKIKEMMVMDGRHLFAFTQKYNKKTKKMKLLTIAVIETRGNHLALYYRRIKGKRYLAIDWLYTGGGSNHMALYRVKGNKLVLNKKFSYIGPFQSSTEEYFYINNKEVRKKKYNSYVKKYFKKRYQLKYKEKIIY